MELDKLLENIIHEKNYDFNPNIEFITCNSNNIRKNSLFACLKGTNFDGHDFAKKAIDLGAKVILVEKDLGLSNQVLVKNTHKAYAKICANFFENPASKLKFIGVTGTNGKTTITNIIKKILTDQGKKVGLIGTIQNEIGSEIFKTEKTTPTHFEYQKILKKMLKKNCEYVVIEVSSQGLEQERIADTNFEISIFTNLSQDHLDYHKTMNNYFEAKKKLFKVSKKSIICVDDEYGKKLAEDLDSEVYTFSIKDLNANFVAENIDISCNGVEYIINLKENYNAKLFFSTPGIFSVYNSMAAFLTCYILGFNQKKIAKSIKLCKPIKGRCENIETGRNFNVICDYAHSPDGLKNILDSVRTFCKGRIVTLFGCGGDRDRKKRPIMGEIAAKNSDFLIITSDNPRTEDPLKIIDNILQGVKKTSTPYVKISNRKKAIQYAIKTAKKNDTIILAGKGHETYQIIGNIKIKLDEREIVEKALQTMQQE